MAVLEARSGYDFFDPYELDQIAFRSSDYGFGGGFNDNFGLASLRIGPDLDFIAFEPSLLNAEDTFQYDVFGGLGSLLASDVASDPAAVVTQPAEVVTAEPTADVFTRAPTEIPTDLSGAQALILANELGLGTGDVARGVSDAQVTQAAQDALTGDLTKADIRALSQAGLGSETGFNIHNLPQSVAEMQAAQNVGDFASKYLVPFLINAIPGAGLAMTGLNLAQGLSSGQMTGAQALSKVVPIAVQAMFPGSAEAAIIGGGISGLLQGQTPGQVAVNAGINIISQQTGLPPGTVAAIANGDFGSVAASTVMSALRTEIAQQTGLPPAVINIGLDLTGAGKTLSSAISGGVNEALGGGNQNNLGAIASYINSLSSGTGTAQAGTAGSGAIAGGALPVGGFLPSTGGAVSSGLDRVSSLPGTTGTTGTTAAATTTTAATTPTRRRRQPVVGTTDFTGGATGSEEGDLSASAGYGGADDYEGYYASDDVTTDTSVDDLFDIVNNSGQVTAQDTTTGYVGTDVLAQAYQDPTRALDTPTNEAAFNQLVEAFSQAQPTDNTVGQDQVQVAASQPGLQPYYLQGAAYYLPDYELLQKQEDADAASQAVISDLARQAQQNVYAEQTANELLQQLGGSSIQDLAQSTEGTVYDVVGDPYADLGETATETAQQTDQGQADLDAILESLQPTDQALPQGSEDIDTLLNEIVGGAQQPTGTEITERERTAFEEANVLPEGGTLETTLPSGTQTEDQAVTEPSAQPDVMDQLVKAGLTEDTDLSLPTTQETTTVTQPVTLPTGDVVTTTPVETGTTAPGADQTTEVVTETPTSDVVLTETPSDGTVTTETTTGLQPDVTGGVTSPTDDAVLTQATTGDATETSTESTAETTEGTTVTQPSTTGSGTTAPTQDVVQDLINAGLTQEDGGVTLEDVVSTTTAPTTGATGTTSTGSTETSAGTDTLTGSTGTETSDTGATDTTTAAGATEPDATGQTGSISTNTTGTVAEGGADTLTGSDTITGTGILTETGTDGTTSTTGTVDTTGTTSTADTSTTGTTGATSAQQLTAQDVTNIVNQTLAANPGLSTQDVQNVVNTALSNLPAGLTAADVNTAISGALSSLPSFVTPDQMQGAVDKAIEQIQGSQLTAGDVTNIVNKAIEANPGLNIQDVKSVVNDAISNIPAGLTKDDVNTAINNALGTLPASVTPEQMQGAVNNAIQEIQKSQVTTKDVTDIVNKAIEANPGLNIQDVKSVVKDAISNIPAGLTATDVNTAITNVLDGLPDSVTADQMQGAINTAVQDLKETQLTADQVNSIVNAALTSNPGLDLEDVQEVVSNAIDNLPAGITAADVNTAVTTAISNLPASVTPAQLTTAVNNAVSTAVQTSQAQSANQMQQLMAMLGSRGGQKQAAQPTVYTPVLANLQDTFDIEDLFMGGKDKTTVEDLLSIIGAGRRS